MFQSNSSKYLAVSTKPFQKCLKSLRRKNKKDIAVKAYAAVSEYQHHGSITTLKPTKHGESRIKDCEKFNLGDGHRLVTIFKDNTRYFVYAETHDNTEIWLNKNRNRKIVIGDDDQILFLPIAETKTVDFTEVFNPLTTEDELNRVLLEPIPDTILQTAGFSNESVSLIKNITLDEWEDNSDEIIDSLLETCDEKVALLLIDLMSLATDGDITGIHDRINVHVNSSPTIEEILEADEELEHYDINQSANSDQIIDPRDLDIAKRISSIENWSEWMLFMHPSQERFCKRSFNGPTRLRGMSGSGKTCVLVHRARHLAKHYSGDKIACITLTNSMAKLLSKMLDDLCGSDSPLRKRIHVSTVSKFIRKTTRSLDARRKIDDFLQIQDSELKIALTDAEALIKSDPLFSQSKFSKWSDRDFRFFFSAEIRYIRGRLKSSEYNDYLSAKTFARTGRGIPLSESDRSLIFKGLDLYNKRVSQKGSWDAEGFVEYCNSMIEWTKETCPYRCLLIDEVQDLSQMEMNFIGKLNFESEEDSIFLVGDGAQSVYNKGFSLKSAGISVANRSYILTRNYRNSFEILSAAFEVIKGRDFLDTDESSRTSVIKPELAEFRSEKPIVYSTKNFHHEINYIKSQIKDAHESGIEYGNILIVAPYSYRNHIITKQPFSDVGAKCSELRERVTLGGDEIKLSTIESAKGHEFEFVIICGVNGGNRGLLQNSDAASDIDKEASKLYVAMTRARDRLLITFDSSTDNAPNKLINELGNKVKWIND